jgi:hypothetical protein
MSGWLRMNPDEESDERQDAKAAKEERQEMLKTNSSADFADDAD